MLLVLRVCQTVIERQRYFVVEQPWSAESWRYDGVLARLWQRDDVWLVRGDQCAYGKVDSESGLPYLKATGFMTNSQLIEPGGETMLLHGGTPAADGEQQVRQQDEASG